MANNEAFINEICAELQQLCTELEKITATPHQNNSGNKQENREQYHPVYPSGRRSNRRNPEQPEGICSREQSNNRYP